MKCVGRETVETSGSLNDFPRKWFAHMKKLDLAPKTLCQTQVAAPTGSRPCAPTSRCRTPGGSATRPITVIRPQRGPSSTRPSTPWAVCTRSTSTALAARPRYALEGGRRGERERPARTQATTNTFLPDFFFFFTQYTSCSFSVSLKLDLFMQMSFCRASIKLNIVHLWSPLTCLTDCWDLPKHRSEYFGGDVWGGLETRLHETPCRGGLCRELPHNSQRNKGAVTLPSVDCRTSTDHRDDWILRWWITAHTDLCYL